VKWPASSICYGFINEGALSDLHSYYVGEGFLIVVIAGYSCTFRPKTEASSGTIIPSASDLTNYSGCLNICLAAISLLADLF